MNFEVTTTSGLLGPITLCFTLTNITDAATFDRLRILHNENNVLVDRTLLPPDPQAPDFTIRTICARVDSLSPFSIAQKVDPALAMISGVVVDTDGNAVSGVFLSISGTGSFPMRTDARGVFTFPNLEQGGSYAILPSDSSYDFDPPLALVEALSGTNALAFIAREVVGPELTLTADPTTPGEFTLAWPVTSLSYTLEFTESLTEPTWTAVPVAPFIQERNNLVTLQASTAPVFFRLRQ